MSDDLQAEAEEALLALAGKAACAECGQEVTEVRYDRGWPAPMFAAWPCCHRLTAREFDRLKRILGAPNSESA